MNEVVKKSLLAGYIPKVIPWMHLKHPRFPYSAWGTITKTKKELQVIQNIMDMKED